MNTEQEDPRERVWRLLIEKEHYTHCPKEVMGALDALGVTLDVEVAHSVMKYDDSSGVTEWTVVAATGSALIRMNASATRSDKQVWGVTQYRESVEYSVPPKVDVDVRPLTDIERVQLVNVGATNAWQSGTQVVQSWKFTLRGGESIDLQANTGDRLQSEAVGQMCALFARQVTGRAS